MLWTLGAPRSDPSPLTVERPQCLSGSSRDLKHIHIYCSIYRRWSEGPLELNVSIKSTGEIFYVHTHTCQFSGHADLSLQGIDLRMDEYAVVISHPVGLDHPLLQNFTHILLCHVQNAQVGKTAEYYLYIIYLFKGSEQEAWNALNGWLGINSDLMLTSLDCWSAMQIPFSHCLPTRLWAWRCGGWLLVTSWTTTRAAPW